MKRIIGKNLKDALFDAMDKISKKENEDYTKGDLEKKAREIQTDELNNRPK